jgi:hypothetical protein
MFAHLRAVLQLRVTAARVELNHPSGNSDKLIKVA